jgi:hypothetical protein
MAKNPLKAVSSKTLFLATNSLARLAAPQLLMISSSQARKTENLGFITSLAGNL